MVLMRDLAINTTVDNFAAAEDADLIVLAV
jgi:hypothetical protein